MSNNRARFAMAAVCALTLTISACSSDSKSGSDASTAGTTAGSSAPVGLTIEGSSFSASSVAAGTEFTISNKDGVTHTVTDDAGSFDIRVPGGGTATLMIPDAGDYKIHCEIHGSMHGTITVA